MQKPKQSIKKRIGNAKKLKKNENKQESTAKPRKTKAEYQKEYRERQKAKKNENKQESTAKPRKTKADYQKEYRERQKAKKNENKQESTAKPRKTKAEYQKEYRARQKAKKNENKQESTAKPRKTNAERQKAFRERQKMMKIKNKRESQMPPKESNLNNASSKGSRRKRVERAQQLPEQIETRNAAERIRTAESRAQESQEQRDERGQQNITRTRATRERNIATVRVLDRQRQRISRSLTRASFVRLAFEYAPDINYSGHSKIAIGGMDKVCQYCQALKFRNEAAGMCCASGKVVLSPLPAPPEPLLSLLTGNSDDSKLFLRKIRKFNSCFQMTSFGATKICDRASDGRNFETTFKIQGQVYHKIGSLMPMPDNNPKFLQIYFMGDCEERVTTRCLYNFIEQAEERAIVILLENFLEDHNQLIQLIKRVSPRLQNDNYQIVIKADKVPLDEHAGRFNAPTVDEVAVIMVGDPVDKRSIKITRRDNTVSTISDLHRSYSNFYIIFI
ncbi:uncharacterized protein LOC135127238 isoform X2 [Zophobas morio]|uniref:uncharacterized protein LOC135127238 isoform X2 n=1 Tax=Zophobas morio TaxID=2755281 RepID=UPI003083DAFC